MQWSGYVIVDSGASDKAVGAVLSKVQERKENAIVYMYMSKALNQHEHLMYSFFVMIDHWGSFRIHDAEQI
jgi:hypothetical protein